MRRPAHSLWIALALQAALFVQAAALLPVNDFVSALFGSDEVALDDSSDAPSPSPQIAEEELEAELPPTPSLIVSAISSADLFHLHLAPRDGHRASLDRPPRT